MNPRAQRASACDGREPVQLPHVGEEDGHHPLGRRPPVGAAGVGQAGSGRDAAHPLVVAGVQRLDEPQVRELGHAAGRALDPEVADDDDLGGTLLVGRPRVDVVAQGPHPGDRRQRGQAVVVGHEHQHRSVHRPNVPPGRPVGAGPGSVGSTTDGRAGQRWGRDQRATWGGAVIETGSVSHLEAIVRLATAGGLGALIGFEREVDGHEAGVRTHSLLALGAALFGLLSVSAFSDFVAGRNDTNVTIDVSRIASYIPAGIGFLGGGVILKRHNRVKGLTTAASLWVVSAVGLAAGLGAWLAACTATALCLVGLLAERPLGHLMARLRGHAGHLRVEVAPDSSTATLAALVDLVGARGRLTRIERADDGGLSVEVWAGPRSPAAIAELAATVADLPGVQAVEDVTGTG